MLDKNWKIFEEKSKDYLNTELKFSLINVKLGGGSNSIIPDLILHDKDDNKLFSIEAKLSPSQAGQIVIQKSNNRISLSEKSKSANKYSEIIINKLNSDLILTESKLSNYQELDMLDNNLLSDWIKEHYSNKGSKFIITSSKLESYYAIIPINEIDIFFEIKAIMRHKRSGTVDVPNKEKSIVTKEIIKNLGKTAKFEILGKKLILNISDKKIKSNYFGQYYFSKIAENKFRIVKRSNTNNLNIIFTLKYIGLEENNGLDKLLKCLG